MGRPGEPSSLWVEQMGIPCRFSVGNELALRTEPCLVMSFVVSNKHLAHCGPLIFFLKCILICHTYGLVLPADRLSL